MNETETLNYSGGEEAIIQTFLAPLAAGYPGAFGLRDDCAVMSPQPGMDLVLKTDPIRAGVHFFADDAPADIAWKALAVNVSDLAAKGATPAVYLLALAFPTPPTPIWMAAFADGLGAAQAAFGCHLIGGDTDRAPGPLSVAITAIGTVPVGTMLRRGSARAGDHVFVSGTIGDATLGLAVRQTTARSRTWNLSADERQQLLQRYLRPQPRLALTPALRRHASASMDVSDGLLKDFDRLCRASGVAGIIEAARVPLSLVGRRVLGRDPKLLATLLGGGDDYEILCTVPAVDAAAFVTAATAAHMPVQQIGSVADGGGVVVRDAAGVALDLPATGWDHF